MGKAARWLKGLFGITNKKKDQIENLNSPVDRKDKKSSSFSYSVRSNTGLCDNPTTIPPNITPAEAAWLRSFYSESGKEQNKHAIVVAAATAAAADAAVAAAQAAVAVVRLTSQGRGTMFNDGSRENWAAVKIQTVFRGCLARKALRALKGLVKLQAVVRGFLVRKQAYATLHSMKALIRAQARIRAKKSTRLILNDDENFAPQFRPRNSMEKYDDSRSVCNVSRHSRRLSASSENINGNILDQSPKIVQVDTGRPKSRSRRTKTWWISDYGEDSHGQITSSPFPCQNPACLLIPDGSNLCESQSGFTGDECRFSTARSTPRFANSCGSNGPGTPTSDCVASYFKDYENCPSYMAKTQSFKAKLRSYSAPKQRPEMGYKRRLSLHEMMESRNSLSGVRMQRSCTRAQEVVNAYGMKSSMDVQLNT